jgi:hypothetical protein
LLIESVSCASPLRVSAMSDTVPIDTPDTSNRSPETIWLALANTALTV